MNTLEPKSESACWYTTGAAARLLGVQPMTIARLCAAGKVKGTVSSGPHRGTVVEAKKEDGHWKIPVEWLGPVSARRNRRPSR